jgi:hypothetical protein
MTTPSWSISGRYFETCSCDFVCPCILTQMTARPTKGSCTFAMALDIEHGSFGQVELGGIPFIVLALTPGPMSEGNWSIGLIVDERASSQQQDAIAAIASGAAGGPMTPLAGLIGTFLGIERAPITIETDGVKWSATTDGLVDISAQGVMGIDPRNPQPLTIDNTGHPVNSRLALARALRSHVHALGLDWDDTSGKNNGHYAPFNWSNAA